MRSPRNRTWFCSTSMVAPRRDVSEAGLFELHYSLNRVVPTSAQRADAQDEGAHRGFPAPRRTHEKNLGYDVSEIGARIEALCAPSSSFLWTFRQRDQVRRPQSPRHPLRSTAGVTAPGPARHLLTTMAESCRLLGLIVDVPDPSSSRDPAYFSNS